jgi:hypothetical protein
VAVFYSYFFESTLTVKARDMEEFSMINPWNLSIESQTFLTQIFHNFHLRCQSEPHLRTVIYTAEPWLWKPNYLPFVHITPTINPLPLNAKQQMDGFLAWLRNSIHTPSRYWYFHDASRVSVILSKEPVFLNHYLLEGEPAN